MSNCTRCGRCCFHMKPYIIIERSISGREHHCRCTLSKDRFFARTAPVHDGEADDALRSTHPDACPFLRIGPGDQYTCAAYSSRPAHCRSFFCKRFP